MFECQRDTYIWNTIALSEKKDIDMCRFITNEIIELYLFVQTYDNNLSS